MNSNKGYMCYMSGLLCKFFAVLKNNFAAVRKGFTLTELLIGLAVVAVLAILIVPVVTTRAQNKSFAVSYETEVKQMLHSLEGLPVNENKDDISRTMMYAETDTGSYQNTSGAYINKYMKVSKYCGDNPGDCFGTKYYQYKNNDRTEFNLKDVKGACALLKNGSSICLKPQVKNANGKEEITGWIDINGPKGPNIYGRDLRTFTINLKQHAAFTEEAPGEVIITDAPAPCEGEQCKDKDLDPCTLFPKGRECCTKEGYAVKDVNDLCCRWYTTASSNPNYLICNPWAAQQETPDIDKCINHTITGPSDDCCVVLEANGKHDPACCDSNSTSDYCCGINPNTEKCCHKRIEADSTKFSQGDACCKHKSVFDKYDFCKSVCDLNRDSKACCDTQARRNEVSTPDDACCMFEAVNGLDSSGKSLANKNEYCCRLPGNHSEQCCKWKYEHINSSLDFYAKHDYNTDTGMDSCCNGGVRGVKYTEGKSDAKSTEVLKRCCTVNKAQPTEKEDELCCDYLVEQLGQDSLVHGQALRRCCKYSKWKDKPQCCSHDHDGLASQTYDANVPWASQCCMPNSIYKNDVTPHVNCCFVDIQDNGNQWNNKRVEACCSYGDKTHDGHKVNTESKWQLNCCHLKRAKYPSGASGLAAYNENCCKAKSGNKTIWSSDDECCHTLLEQNPSNNGLENWKANCCHMPTSYGSNAVYRENCCTANTTDYKRKNNSSVREELEHCCHPDAPNPAKECCEIFKATDTSKSGAWKDRDNNNISEAYKIACCRLHDVCPEGGDACKIRSKTNTPSRYNLPSCCTDLTMNSEHKGDSAWKQACCDYPSYYESYAAYRDGVSGCCSLTTDRTRIGTGDKSSNLDYCCLPNSVTSFSLSSDGNSYTIGGIKPAVSCCNLFKSKGWKDYSGTSLNRLYQLACCTYGSQYCAAELTCQEKWALGGAYRTGSLPSCCLSMDKMASTDTWKSNCCNSASVKGTSSYKSYCCQANYTGVATNGSTTWDDTAYCCNVSSVGNAKCCGALGNTQWYGSNKCCNGVGLNYSNQQETRCCPGWGGSGYASGNLYCCEFFRANGHPTISSAAANWSAACCSVYNNTTTTKNGLSENDFKSYCCSDGSGNVKGGGQNKLCCNGSSISDFCCEQGYSNQCSCAKRLAKGYDLNVTVNGSNCCSATKSSYSNANWYSKCCTAANPGGLDSSTFISTCCSNTTSTSLRTSGTNNACCRAASAQCCDVNSAYCTCTSGSSEGSKSNWRSKCCTSSIPSGMSSSDYTSYCCKSTTGKATWNGSNNVCCRAASAECCDVNQAYCTCTNGANEKDKANWKTKCCGSTKPSGMSDADYLNYCCNNTTSTGTKGGGTNNACCRAASAQCCDVNSAYCTCADANVSAESGKTNWKSKCCVSAKSSSLSDANYKSKCCTGSGTGVTSTGAQNKLCCDGSTISDYCCDQGYINQCSCVNGKNGQTRGNHYRVGCCDGSTVTSDGSNYCCKNKSTNQCACANNLGALVESKGNSTRCCVNSSSYISDWCCDNTSNYEQCSCTTGKNGQTRGNHYRVGCCDGSTVTSDGSNYCCKNKSTNQCACANNLGALVESKGNVKRCCYNSASYKSTYCCGQGNQNQCSCSDSYGNTTSGTKWGGCCSNNTAHANSSGDWCCQQGYTNQCRCLDAYGNSYNGNRAGRCCNNSTSYANSSGDWCCTQGYTNQCRCLDAYGNSYNGNRAGRCCNNSTSYANSSGDWCCTQGYQNQCRCTGNGTAYNIGNVTRCCSGTGNDWCCNQNKSYCNCAQKYAKSANPAQSSYWGRTRGAYTSTSTESCCTGSGRITGADWLAGCCSGTYLYSASGSRTGSETNGEFAQCCVNLYQTNLRGTYFYAGSDCCNAVGDNGTGTAFPECRNCALSSLYSSGYTNVETNNYTSAAYNCCQTNSGLVSNSSNWANYCCLITVPQQNGKYRAWAFNSYPACCDKRRSSSGVYAYTPAYYGSSDATCLAGGRDSQCSTWQYNGNYGYYCGTQSACNAWRYKGATVTAAQQKACCDMWGSNPPAALKNACCSVSSNTYSYCDICEGWKNGTATLTTAQKQSCCAKWTSSTVPSGLKSTCCSLGNSCYTQKSVTCSACNRYVHYNHQYSYCTGGVNIYYNNCSCCSKFCGGGYNYNTT